MVFPTKPNSTHGDIFLINLASEVPPEVDNFGFLFESIIKPIHLGFETLEIATKWKKRKEGVSSNSLKYYITYFYIGLKIKMYFKRH